MRHSVAGAVAAAAALLLLVLLHTTNIHDIVAPNQDLTQVASEFAVNPLLSVGQLQVHVGVNRDQKSCI